MVKVPFVMNGYKVTPDPNTGVISKQDVIYSLSDRVHKGYVTYVLVNIDSQDMMYVRDGKVIFTSSVVTGRRGKYDTPKGRFSVLSKARNVNLKGQTTEEEWDVMVDYWIAFIGGSYGFHDAQWRSSFGGEIYRWDGSHGCINLPLSIASRMYYEVPVGTAVFIE